MNVSGVLKNQVTGWRIFSFIIVIALIFSLYIVRLLTLQVTDYDEYIALAEENRISEISISTLRGVIYDRNGIVLARNIASYDVAILPAQLPDDPGEIQEIFRELSAIIDVPVNLGEVSPATPYVPCVSEHGIAQLADYGITSAPYRTVKIKCNIDRTLAMVIQEKAVDWPGVQIEIEPIRDYPTGSLTASIIGFLGPISQTVEAYYRDRGFVPNRDKIGYAGIESYFETI